MPINPEVQLYRETLESQVAPLALRTAVFRRGPPPLPAPRCRFENAARPLPQPRRAAYILRAAGKAKGPRSGISFAEIVRFARWRNCPVGALPRLPADGGISANGGNLCE
jgi:hypothetical protein